MPLMYGGFLVFFLATTVFLVRRGAQALRGERQTRRVRSTDPRRPLAARSTSS